MEAPIWGFLFGCSRLEIPIWVFSFGNPRLEIPVWRFLFRGSRLEVPVWRLRFADLAGTYGNDFVDFGDMYHVLATILLISMTCIAFWPWSPRGIGGRMHGEVRF